MSDIRTVEIVKKMPKEEINIWSILISVLKNHGKQYGTVDNIVSDIEVVKAMIKHFD